MADYWLEQRRTRVTATGRTPFAVAHKDYDGGGIAFVPGEFLADGSIPDSVLETTMHDQLLAPDTGWLEDTGLALWRYTGPEDLPVHVARLRRNARQAGLDPRIALHYALTGETYPGIPRGGPASAPLTAAVAPSGGTWGTATDVLVAVLDTGIDQSSPSALGGPGGASPVRYEATDVDALVVPPPTPGAPATLGCEAGHGTFIVSLVNRFAAFTRIAVIKVLDVDGIGSEKTVVEGLKRLRHSEGPPPQIINLSLGGYTDDGGWPAEDEQSDAKKKAAYHEDTLLDHMPLALDGELGAWAREHPETVFVCAAGNDGIEGRPFWPAAAAATAWPNGPASPPQAPVVVAVASTDSAGRPSSFSNRGPWVTVSTLGEEILGEYVAGAFPIGVVQVETFTTRAAFWSGTSFATPLVAAEIARTASNTNNAAGGGPVPPDAALNAVSTWLKALADSPHAGMGRAYDPRSTGPTLDPRAP